MPIGSAFHERTLPLCESLNYREWAGYYAVSAYETHHEHEYNAIRNAAALIDVSPLFKYIVTGRDATRLVDRLITRDATKLAVGQVIYTPWCDEQGKVIDDGTVSRLEEQRYRWTAADPSLRWFVQNAVGLDVSIEDVSETVAALAVQGPTSGALLRQVAEADVDGAEVFQRDEREHRRCARRHFAHRLHGRSRLRNLDAVGPRDARVGCACRGRRALRSPARRHACARRRAHRSRTAAHRGGFLQLAQSAHSGPAVFAVRDGAGPAGSARQGHVRRPVGACGRNTRAAPRVRLSA